MKVKLFLRAFLYVSLFFSTMPSYHVCLSASQICFDGVTEIELEALSLVKIELENTRNILLKIKETQNPTLIKSTLSATQGALKELIYITSAITLGGGSVLAGFGLIVGEQNMRDFFNNPSGQGAALIMLPGAIISMIATYACLKLIFGRLLASSSNGQEQNIKESLAAIDRTINRLNYEIKKIERVSVRR